MKKVPHSIASYKNDQNKATCNLYELAQRLINVNEVPEKLNLTKATEISLLAKYALLKLQEEKALFEYP